MLFANRYGDCWQTTQRYHFPIHLSVRYQDGNENYWRIIIMVTVGTAKTTGTMVTGTVIAAGHNY